MTSITLDGVAASLDAMLSAAADLPPAIDPTERAILDAVLACVARVGLRRVTIDDVAREAGVGRATVFRRFTSKGELFRRAMAQLGWSLLQDLDRAVVRADPLEDFIEHFVRRARARTHPAVARMIRDDALRSLHDDPGLVALLRAVVERELSRAVGPATADTAAFSTVVDLLVRYLLSLAQAPSLDAAGTSDEAARRHVAALVSSLLPSSTPAAPAALPSRV